MGQTTSHSRRMRRSTRNRRTSDFHPLQRRGIAAIAMGIALLQVPDYLDASPMMAAIAGGLRVPAWLAIGAGVGMLAVYFYFRLQAAPLAGIEARKPVPLDAERRRALRRRLDDAIREHDKEDEIEARRQPYA